MDPTSIGGLKTQQLPKSSIYSRFETLRIFQVFYFRTKIVFVCRMENCTDRCICAKQRVSLSPTRGANKQKISSLLSKTVPINSTARVCTSCQSVCKQLATTTRPLQIRTARFSVKGPTGGDLEDEQIDFLQKAWNLVTDGVWMTNVPGQVISIGCRLC